MKGRILRLSFDHQIFSQQEYGGISRYFVELAKQVAQVPEWDVRVHCPIFLNRYLRDLQRERPALVRGTFLFPRPKTGRIIRAIDKLLTPPLLRRFHPRVVHETYYSFSPVAPRTASTVLTVFDMIHERFREHFAPDDRTTAAKRAAVARADHLICISESTKKDLVELFGVNPAKATVIYLGHSLSPSLTAQPARLLAEPYILYVGSRDGYKNFAGLLRAYAADSRLQNDFTLMCFGGGPITAKENELRAKLGIPENRLRWRGGSDATLSALYRHASLFVYPSLYEGFGIPPLEAMALGCPVACSQTSSLPEVAGNAAEYFQPENSESILRGIQNVLYSKERSKELVAAGTQQLAAFSWAKCAEETRGIYEKL